MEWMDWREILVEVQRFGIERVFHRYYGFYAGNVTDIRDPQKRGRIRALVPGVGARLPAQAWFSPMMAAAGANHGQFHPPTVGDSVFVCFENGDPSRPLAYVGGWYGNPNNVSEVPTELGYESGSTPAPRRFGWVTRLGHALIFNETPGAEAVELRWHQAATGDAALTDLTKTADRSRGKTSKLTFEVDGSVQVLAASGAKVRLDDAATEVRVVDAHGNEVLLSSAGVKVTASPKVVVEAASVEVKASSVTLGDGATHPLIHGDSMLQWAATHTHGTPSGPSGPPVAPPPPSLLSTVVKGG